MPVACPNRSPGRAGNGCSTQYRGARRGRGSARASACEAGVAAVRAEHVRHGVEQRAQLGVAEAGPLDRSA